MTTKTTFTQSLAITGGVAGLGLAGMYVGGEVHLSVSWKVDLWARIQFMLVATALIERTVEVYLNVASMNGDDRLVATEGAKQKDGTRPATVASILLGLLVALSGVRLMETLGAPGDDAGAISQLIWNGVDIAISGGLMAGGSALFHEAAEAVRGGLKTLGRNIGPSASNNDA
jgi:hypothetical protein